MRLPQAWMLLLILGGVLQCQTEARRFRSQRPLPQEEEAQEEETINYYAAEPQDDEGQVVLVSSADRYNGLYGQPQASGRAVQDNYRAAQDYRAAQENYIPRSSHKEHASSRAKEAAKAPPVQTIRNYNKVNDDGSFTFGYEAADGSFKEETRGTDCVVRGKYGYIDPDGNKREFTYVSGNPCDPNAPKEDEQEESNEAELGNEANTPANYPTRPIHPIRRPIATSAPKPAVTLFQTNYAQEEEQPEPEQLLRPTSSPARRPSHIIRPQYRVQPDSEEDSQTQVYQRPQIYPTTPSSVIYKSSIEPIPITPRPISITPTASARTQLPATTFRPSSLGESITSRPELLYTKQAISLQSPSTVSPSRNVNFENEFQKFQHENNVVSPTPSRNVAKSTTPKPVTASVSSGQIYSSALLFDPATGQYNNQLYQSLPQSDGEFLLKQRIQPYVQQPRQQVLNLQQLQQQSPLYSQALRTQPIATQAAYQAQQAETQFQNSAQLYAQQQRARAQQEQQRQQARQQPVYYIQPSADSTGALASSQLDAFLRGHNIQF